MRFQYQIGQLYSVIEASRENTNGDTGVEIVANEPFDNERGSGQYTHKIYHMGRYALRDDPTADHLLISHYQRDSKVPGIVAALLPASSLTLIEKAWNAYPHCRTGTKATRCVVGCDGSCHHSPLLMLSLANPCPPHLPV